MHTIDPNAQIKLVAVDMDGTFLDGQGKIPEAAWALIDQLQARGIKFVPASGRQFATLRFPEHGSRQQPSLPKTAPW